jgi:hypothetical protein
MSQSEKLELLSEHTRHLYTVKQFIAKQNGSWPSESALRAIILDAAWGKNNFQAAFKRVNRRVLIDSDEFWAAVDRMQEGPNHG